MMRGYFDIRLYQAWAEDVWDIIASFSYSLGDLKGGRVYGFAASAKGNTLLNCAKIERRELPYIVDQTPEKIGKYSPGTGIPIISMEEMIEKKPDYLVVLSWNFMDEIKQKCKAAGYAGSFIHPLTMEISN